MQLRHSFIRAASPILFAMQRSNTCAPSRGVGRRTQIIGSDVQQGSIAWEAPGCSLLLHPLAVLVVISALRQQTDCDARPKRPTNSSAMPPSLGGGCIQEFSATAVSRERSSSWFRSFAFPRAATIQTHGNTHSGSTANHRHCAPLWCLIPVRARKLRDAVNDVRATMYSSSSMNTDLCVRGLAFSPEITPSVCCHLVVYFRPPTMAGPERRNLHLTAPIRKPKLVQHRYVTGPFHFQVCNRKSDSRCPWRLHMRRRFLTRSFPIVRS